MSIQEDILGIEGLCLIKPEIINDEMMIYSKADMQKHNLNDIWVQELTASFKQADTIGLYGLCCSKLVRVVNGSVYHYFYDCRENSVSKSVQAGIITKSSMKETIYVPSGVAHGMSTISQDSIVVFSLEQYFCSDLIVKLLSSKKFIDSIQNLIGTKELNVINLFDN